MEADSRSIPAEWVRGSIYAPIGSSRLEEDSQIINGPGWYQIVTPSVKNPSINEVILSQVPDSEIDSRINESFELYHKHQLPFKWAIGPMSSPAIEGKISQKAQEIWDFRGMAIANSTKIKTSDEIIVERVSQNNFEEFIGVFCNGWGFDGLIEKTRLRFKSSINEATTHPYYLARNKSGIPIATAGTVLKDNYGYLVGAVVLENFRGSGAYRSLISARLSELSQMGFKFAVTQAREATSAPILEKLGFETTFKAKIYKF